jgi:hypothetical protein
MKRLTSGRCSGVQPQANPRVAYNKQGKLRIHAAPQTLNRHSAICSSDDWHVCARPPPVVSCAAMLHY